MHNCQAVQGLTVPDAMHIQKFLIAGGNFTALVSRCPGPDRPALLHSLLEQVEQVGFIHQDCHLPRIQMMGGEFCINATLAFASTLGPSGTLAASGARRLVSFCNTEGETSIRLPMQWHRQDNVILMEGIGFALWAAEDKKTVGRDELSALSMRHSLPAFGAILYENNVITPYVYVAGVDSFVKETACGSGSIALYLYNGTSRVQQPTGQLICVSKEQEFHVSARVTAIDE